MMRYCLPSRRFFGWLGFQFHRLRRGQHAENERTLAAYALPFIEKALAEQREAETRAERQRREAERLAEWRREQEEGDARYRAERAAEEERLAAGRRHMAREVAAADARIEAALPAAREQLRERATARMDAWWAALPLTLYRVEYTLAISADGEPYGESFLSPFDASDFAGWWTVIESGDLVLRKVCNPNATLVTEIELDTPERAVELGLASRLTLRATVRAWTNRDGVPPLERMQHERETVIRPHNGLLAVLDPIGPLDAADLAIDVDPLPSGFADAGATEADDEPPY